MGTDHVVVQGNDMWCKACGKREPLLLPLSVKDFSIFVQAWTEQHKACASYSKRGDSVCLHCGKPYEMKEQP